MSKNIGRNSFAYLLYIVVNAVLTFGSSIYVARILQQTDIGDVLYAQNTTQYFIIFAMLGIPAYGIREIAKSSDNADARNKLISELFCIQFISTVIFLSIYVGIVFSRDMPREKLMIYLITGIGIGLNALNLTWMYEGLEKFVYISVRGIVVKIFTFILMILLVKNQDDYLAYAAITVFGVGMGYFINMCYSVKCVRFQIIGLGFRIHMKPLMYLFVVNLITEGYSLVDTTLLGSMGSSVDVTVFSYANKIYLLLIEALNAITAVAVPKMAYSYKNDDREGLGNIISTAFKLVILAAIPAVVGVIFVAKDMVVILYGGDYLNSAYVLMVLAPLFIITSLCNLLGTQVLLISGNEKKMLIAIFVGIIVKIIAGYILIPELAEIGVAIACVIGGLVVFAVSIGYSHVYYKLFKVKRQVIRCVSSCAIMGMGLAVIGLFDFSVNYGVAVKIGGAVILYFGVLCLFALSDKSKKHLQ